MRSEFTQTGERQIVVRGEFILCALLVLAAFLFATGGAGRLSISWPTWERGLKVRALTALTTMRGIILTMAGGPLLPNNDAIAGIIRLASLQDSNP